MSRTTPVLFGEAMFWADEVALGVLFVEAARIAEEVPPEQRMPWSEGLVRTLRVDAIMGHNHAVPLDEFCVEARQAVLSWLAEAASRLVARGGVSRAEVEQWDVLDGYTVPNRGTGHLDPGPLAELAQAVADLVAGTLPAAPEGRYWYIGTPAGRVLQGGPRE
jgi:hypothetical protein